MDPHFEGVIFKTHSGEVRRRLRAPFPPFIILDVRPREEWERARIPGSLSAPPEGLKQAALKPTGPVPQR